MNALSPRLHALLSYGLLVMAILAVFWTVVRPPLSGRADFFEELSASRTRYTRFQETITANERAAEKAAALESSGVERDRFLHADTEALAAAQLQEHLTRLTEAGPCRLASAHADTPTEELLFPPIVVSMEISCSVAALTDLLYRLEHGRPDLQADNLLIQRRESSRRGTDESIEELAVRFDVTGFLYRESSQ